MRKLEERKGKAMIEEESELECTKSANYVNGGGVKWIFAIISPNTVRSFFLV